MDVRGRSHYAVPCHDSVDYVVVLVSHLLVSALILELTSGGAASSLISEWNSSSSISRVRLLLLPPDDPLVPK